MEERYRSYYRKMWETKCARFNAHARFEALSSRASYAVIALTLAVLAIAAFKAGSFLGASSEAQKAGDIALVLCSVALLALELYIKGQRYEDKAAQFHRSGKLISRVYDKFVFSVNKTSLSESEIEEVIDEYHNAIDVHGVNHAYVDKQLLMAQHPSDYGHGCLFSFFYRIYVEAIFYIKGGGVYSIAATAVLLGTLYFIWDQVSA